jgi:hypothetical protein
MYAERSRGISNPPAAILSAAEAKEIYLRFPQNEREAPDNLINLVSRARTTSSLRPTLSSEEVCGLTRERELIWVYERGKANPELRSLDHVAAQKDYYSVKSQDGTKIQALEEILSRVEGLAAPLIQRFQQGEKNISDDDRMTFSVFLSFGTMRTPKFRGAVEELVEESMDSYSKKLAGDPEKFAESVRETLNKVSLSTGI